MARIRPASRFGRQRWLAGRIVPAAVVLGAASVSVSIAAMPSPVQPVVLPRDQGAHTAANVEWWYTAGTLADAAGRDYFWFATIWSSRGARVAKVNVVDLRADRTVLSREFLSATPVSSGQTRLAVGGFTLGAGLSLEPIG